MRDRFVRGLLAGLAGGAVAVALSLLLKDLLKFGTLHFYDISGVMIYGHRRKGLAEKIFAEVGHLGFSATIGIVLAYLFPRMKSTHLWIKGLFFGAAVWFAVYAITVLFKVPEVQETDLSTAIGNLAESAAYGLVTVWVLKKLDRRLAA